MKINTSKMQMTIEFESKDEMLVMYHRYNIGVHYINKHSSSIGFQHPNKDAYQDSKLWYAISTMLHNIGVYKK